MITIALYFFLICSGSAFACAYFTYKFEQVLPITVLSSVFLLYFFGLFDKLLSGVSFVFAVMITLWIIAIIQYFNTPKKKDIIKRFFTPSFMIYLILFLIAVVSNYLRKVSAWDDLTQWADVVKQMCLIDKFGASREGFLLYPNYPPAMALWQYFAQMLNHYITGTVFSEWLLFLAYSSMLYALLIPFTRGLAYRNILLIAIILGTVFVLPAMFHRSQYRLLDVDPILGVLTGVGLYHAAHQTQRDVPAMVTSILLIFTLVLTKEAGIIFAIMLCAAFVIGASQKATAEKQLRKPSRYFIPTVGAVLIVYAWLSWRLYLHVNDAYFTFSNKIQLPVLWHVIQGTRGGYQQQVWQAFIAKPFSPVFPIGIAEIKVSFAGIFIFLMALFVPVLILHRNNENGKYFLRVSVVGFFSTFLFLAGMGVMYMFKFTEEEAVVLASFGRYIGIPLLMLSVFLFGIITDILVIGQRWKKVILIGLVVLLTVTAPVQEAGAFVLGLNREYSNNVRAQVDQDATSIFESLGENEYKINVVSFENDGLDFLMMRFVLRPNHVAGAWYIKKQLFDPADIWLDPPENPQEWVDRLIESDFDYVFIYQVDTEFVENFSNAFGENSSPQEHKLYYVDSIRRLLLPVTG